MAIATVFVTLTQTNVIEQFLGAIVETCTSKAAWYWTAINTGFSEDFGVKTKLPMSEKCLLL